MTTTFYPARFVYGVLVVLLMASVISFTPLAVGGILLCGMLVIPVRTR